MSNNNKTELIDKFFERFSNSTIKSLNNTLDREIYKKIEFETTSYEDITDKNSLKENNAIYKCDYTKATKEHSLAVLLPEELIAFISDILMGGTGENTYKGSLSELEINAAFNLIKTIFTNITTVYNKLCEKEIEFSSKPLLLTKSSAKYDQLFNSSDLDFLVNYTLTINNTQEFKLKLLLDSKELKQTLSRLNGLFQTDAPIRHKILDSMNIDAISDLQVDLTAELGIAEIPMKCALELTKGSMIELDTFVDSNIKVFAEGIEIAEAQVVVIGENLGLRIIKLIPPEERVWNKNVNN